MRYACIVSLFLASIATARADDVLIVRKSSPTVVSEFVRICENGVCRLVPRRSTTSTKLTTPSETYSSTTRAVRNRVRSRTTISTK